MVKIKFKIGDYILYVDKEKDTIPARILEIKKRKDGILWVKIGADDFEGKGIWVKESSIYLQ